MHQFMQMFNLKHKSKQAYFTGTDITDIYT